MSYVYILLTIILTVFGQLVIKWQVLGAGNLPSNFIDKIHFIAKLLMNPWVIVAFLAAFMASVFWMAAMTKFDLSYAYPFTSLSYILVLILSIAFFHEAASLLKMVGMTLIVTGLIIASQG